MQPNFKIPQAPYPRSPMSIVPRTSIIDISLDKLMEQKIREAQYNAQQQAVASRTPTVLTDPLLNFRVRDYYRQKYEQSFGSELAGRLTGAAEGAALGAGIFATIAGAVLALGTVIEDIFTAGVGTADDPASFALAGSLINTGIINTAATIGAGVGAVGGFAASDYSTWYATRDMFANLWRNQSVGRGVLNTLNFVGQSMDMLEGASIVKSTLYSLINSKQIGETIAKAYGLTKEGRTEIEFSMIRESLGLDLGGIGNFIFDMTGEFASDPGSWSGIIIPLATSDETLDVISRSLKQGSNNFLNQNVEQAQNTVNALEAVAKDDTLRKRLLKAIRSENIESVQKLLNSKRALLASDITEDTTKKLVNSINNVAMKNTSMKFYKIAKAHDYIDDTLTGLLWKVGNPGIATIATVKAIHKHSVIPNIISKLISPEASEAYKEFLFGNNAARRFINNVYNTSANNLKSFFFGDNYYKHTVFNDLIKDNIDALDAVETSTIINKYKINDISSLNKLAQTNEEVALFKEKLIKAIKEKYDAFEAQARQLEEDYLEELLISKAMQSNQASNVPSADVPLTERAQELQKQYEALISNKNYNRYKYLYFELTNPSYANIQEHINKLWRYQQLYKNTKTKDLPKSLSKEFSQHYKALVDAYNSGDEFAIDFFNSYGRHFKEFAEKNLTDETRKSIDSVFNIKLENLKNQILEQSPEYKLKQLQAFEKQLKENIIDEKTNRTEWDEFIEYTKNRYEPKFRKVRDYEGNAYRIDVNIKKEFTTDDIYKMMKQYLSDKASLETTDTVNEVVEDIQKNIEQLDSDVRNYIDYFPVKEQYVSSAREVLLSSPLKRIAESDAVRAARANSYIEAYQKLIDSFGGLDIDPTNADSVAEVIAKEDEIIEQLPDAEKEAFKKFTSLYRSIYFAHSWNSVAIRVQNKLLDVLENIKAGRYPTAISIDILKKELQVLEGHIDTLVNVIGGTEKQIITIGGLANDIEAILDDLSDSDLETMSIKTVQFYIDKLIKYRTDISRLMLLDISDYFNNKFLKFKTIKTNALKRISKFEIKNLGTKVGVSSTELLDFFKNVDKKEDILQALYDFGKTNKLSFIGANPMSMAESLINININKLYNLDPNSPEYYNAVQTILRTFGMLSEYDDMYKPFYDVLKRNIQTKTNPQQYLDILSGEQRQSLIYKFKEFNRQYQTIKKYLPELKQFMSLDRSLNLKLDIKSSKLRHIFEDIIDVDVTKTSSQGLKNKIELSINKLGNSRDAIIKELKKDDPVLIGLLFTKKGKNPYEFGKLIKDIDLEEPTKVIDDSNTTQKLLNKDITEEQLKQVKSEMIQNMISRVDRLFQYNYYKSVPSASVHTYTNPETGVSTFKNTPIRQAINDGLLYDLDVETNGIYSGNIIHQISIRHPDGSVRNYYLNPQYFIKNNLSFDETLAKKGITLESAKANYLKVDNKTSFGFNTPEEMIAQIEKDYDPNHTIFVAHNGGFDFDAISYNKNIQNNAQYVLPTGISRSIRQSESAFNYEFIDSLQIMEENLPVYLKETGFMNNLQNKFLTNTDLGAASDLFDVIRIEIDRDGIRRYFVNNGSALTEAEFHQLPLKQCTITQEYNIETGEISNPEIKTPNLASGDVHTASADTALMQVWFDDYLDKLSKDNPDLTFYNCCDHQKVTEQFFDNFIKNNYNIKERVTQLWDLVKAHSFGETFGESDDYIIRLLGNSLLDFDIDNYTYSDIINLVDNIRWATKEIDPNYMFDANISLVDYLNNFIDYVDEMDNNIITKSNQLHNIMLGNSAGYYQMNQNITLMRLAQLTEYDPAYTDLYNFLKGNYNSVQDNQLKQIGEIIVQRNDPQINESLQRAFRRLNEYNEACVWLNDFLNKIPEGSQDKFINMFNVITQAYQDLDKGKYHNVGEMILAIKRQRKSLFDSLDFTEQQLMNELLLDSNLEKYRLPTASSINGIMFDIKDNLIYPLRDAEFRLDSSNNIKPTNNQTELQENITTPSTDSKVYSSLSYDLDQHLQDAFENARLYLKETRRQNIDLRAFPVSLEKLNRESELHIDDAHIQGSPLYNYLSDNADTMLQDGYHRLRPWEAVRMNSEVVFRFSPNFKQSFNTKNLMNKIEANNFNEKQFPNAMANVPLIDAEHSRLAQNYDLAARVLGIDKDTLIKDYFYSGNYKPTASNISNLYNAMFQAIVNGELDLKANFNFTDAQVELFKQFYVTIQNINETTYPYIKNVDTLRSHIIGAFMHQLYDLNSRNAFTKINELPTKYQALYILGKQKTECLFSNEIFNEVKKIYTRTDGSIDYDAFIKYMDEHPDYVFMTLDKEGKWIRLDYRHQPTVDQAFNNNMSAIISRDSYTSYVSDYQKYRLPDKVMWFKNHILRTMKVLSLSWNLPFIFQNASAAELQNVISTEGKINFPRTVKSIIQTTKDYHLYKSFKFNILDSPIARRYIGNSMYEFDNCLDLINNSKFLDDLSKSTDKADQVLFKQIKSINANKLKDLQFLDTVLHTAAASGEINSIMQIQAKRNSDDLEYEEATKKIKTISDKTSEEYKEFKSIIDRHKYQQLNNAELNLKLKELDKQINEKAFLSPWERRRLYRQKAAIETILQEREYKFLNTYLKVTYSNKFLNFNNDMEAIFRTSAIKMYIEDGMSFDQATWETIKRQFVYTDKSLAEQYAEFVVPFISYPIRAALLWEDMTNDANIMDMMYWFNKYTWNDEDTKNQEHSDYLSRRRARGDIPVGDKLLGVTGSPFREAVMSVQNPLYTLNNKINPIAKPFIDLATGVDSDRNRWNQLPVISNVSNIYHSINEQNVLHNITSDYYRYGSYGNYYLPRVNNRIHGTLYNRMYTHSGRSRILMNMQLLNSSNLKYRVDAIMKYGGPYRGPVRY